MSHALLSDWNVRRIMLLGDVHGNSGFLDHAFAAAGRTECDVIVQLGDFGFWEHTKAGREFLDQAERSALVCNVPLLFVDGNHENHELLAALHDDSEIGRDGVCWVRPNIGWITRGTRWEWNHIRFGALGGAASVDRSRRVQGWTWWPEEVCTDADAALLGIEQLDVLVTHDAPSIAGMVGHLSVSQYDLDRCEASRAVIDRAVRRLRPRVIVHGHWHQRHTTHVDGTRVEGFGFDGGSFSEASALLHLPDLAISPSTSSG